MEEYANYGFFYMEDKLTDNPDYFFRKSAFLDLFLNFIVDKSEDDDELESLNYLLQKAKVPDICRAPLLCFVFMLLE